MLNHFLPVMIGCYDKADKCSVVGKDKKFGGYSLLICRLKKRQDFGTLAEKENIGKVICHLHFCKLEAAQAFRDGIVEMVQTWEQEANDEPDAPLL